MKRAVIIGALGAAVVVAVLAIPLIANLGCGAGPDGVEVDRLSQAPQGRVLHLNETHFAQMPLLRTLLDASAHPSAYQDVRSSNATHMDYALGRDASRNLFAFLQGQGLESDFFLEYQGQFYQLEIYMLMC